jgi:hypothetical protein
MDTKIWVELNISGFPMPHEELSQILGVQPTEAENKGDLYHSQSGKSFVLSESAWTLSSGLTSEIGLVEQMEALLNKLRPFKQNFITITSRFSSDLNITIHTSALGTPFIGWENWMIKELAEYNLSMGIDLSIEEVDNIEK